MDDLRGIADAAKDRLQPIASYADFSVGDAWVRPSRLSIDGPSGSVSLEPRVMAVTLVIAEARGEVVSREMLHDKCWPGMIVGDDSLNRAIAEIRRALRVAGSDNSIETIPRVGYRMNAAESGADLVNSPEANVADSHARGLTRRTAIAGGMVAVAAIISGGFAFRQWRQESNLSAMAARFATLLDRNDAISEDEIRALQSLAQQHPDSAVLWGLLARASIYDFELVDDTLQDRFKTAERIANLALQLDPKEPNARYTLATVASLFEDWATTEDRIRAILDDFPDHIASLSQITYLLQGVGRCQESLDFNNRIIELDPLIPAAQLRAAMKHWIFGRNADAVRVIERAAQVWPDNIWVWNARLLVLAFTGRTQAAMSMIDAPSFSPISDTGEAMWRPGLQALETGDAADALVAREAILSAATEAPGLAAYGTMLLSALGELDTAFAIANGLLLKKGNHIVGAVNEEGTRLLKAVGWQSTQWLFTPATKPFREDARFDQFCDDLGLAAYWRTKGVRPDLL